MKNNDYYNYKKSIDDLTSVLSISYFYQYSWKSIENRIIESKYFSLLTSDFIDGESYISTLDLLKKIFPDANVEEVTNVYYNELEWVATMYVNIIKETSLNFETIFIYLPIEEAIKMYKLYHEMDISISLERFLQLKKSTSLIKIKMKEMKITNIVLAEKSGLSKSMIDALKNRKRDIKKLDLMHGIILSKILNVKVETLLNN